MRGLATYSPDSLVWVVKVAPRSTLVTVTLAPATTAPEGSVTVPAMVPVSFWAHSPTDRLKQASNNNRKRKQKVRGELARCMARLLPRGFRLGTASMPGGTGTPTVFTNFYGVLLLLSF